MTVALASTRRLRLPVVDTRVVVGVVLVALSVVGGLLLSGDPAPATPVWVATADLDAGHVLTGDDLRPADVHASGNVLAAMATVARGVPAGRVLTMPLRAGAALPRDALAASVTPGREITVPVTPEHALGGAIRVGDRVDVLATFDKGTDLARTMTLARRAVVRGLVRTDGLFGQQGGALTALTLLVRPDAAVEVAFAARNGEIDVVRGGDPSGEPGTDRVDADGLR